MEQRLQSLIQQAVTAAYPGIDVPAFILSHPDNETHGDYTTNLALVLAQLVGEAPRQVAEKLTAQLPAESAIAKVEVAGPGFINFHLTPSYFLDRLTQVEGAAVGSPQKILFEFGQPNTHKVPHIGHLYSYCYGESCVRLLQSVGNTVYRANYQGDVGLHVAKCLWAYQRKQQTDPIELSAKVAYLQECYQEGSQAYEDSEVARQAIDELNVKIYRKDSSIVADWEKTRQWSLEYYRQFEQRIGVAYDKYYLESQTSEAGLALVRQHVGDIFEEDQGAVIFRGEQYGLHTRVFINRLGNPTYEAKDIGLAAFKKQDWDFDLSVYTTAVEQNEYWRVLVKAIELVFPDYVGKIKHIGFGMINLTSGKMSSRTGKILTAFSLVETVKERVKEYIKVNRDYSVEETEEIAETVAVGAIKYSFLKSAAGKNISFDLESSIAFDGNSGPYLQYTYARCQSILAKAGSSSAQSDFTNYSLNNDELAVLRWLDRFNEIVIAAATGYAPHILCGYLFELAQRYSYFYNQNQILADDEATSAFRVALTEAVGQKLQDGLKLLGIETLNRI